MGGGSSASAEGAAESDRRGPLEFVPEEVLAQGGMTVDSALAFLQYHCVDFYTDEDGEDQAAANSSSKIRKGGQVRVRLRMSRTLKYSVP